MITKCFLSENIESKSSSAFLNLRIIFDFKLNKIKNKCSFFKNQKLKFLIGLFSAFNRWKNY